MKTLAINILDNRAFEILRDLEALNLIRLHYNEKYQKYVDANDWTESKAPSTEELKKRVKELF